MKVAEFDIKREIESAGKILIGLGEEFEEKDCLKNNKEYLAVLEQVSERRMEWVIPYIDTCFLVRTENRIEEALKELYALIGEKDYFILSTCMNGCLKKVPFDRERLTEPCGVYDNWQCKGECKSSLKPVTADFLQQVDACIKGEASWEYLETGVCDECGESLEFNNIYTENYREEGYLVQWEKYTNWLQNTLNKKLCILELGVGMQYPSIIRWPFEKIAFYNQKAVFFRIHKKLFHLTEELKNRGYAIPENAVSFLLNNNEMHL